MYVDDYIPCHPKSDCPVFAMSKHDGHLWVMLMEKAWAKLHGSYCMTRQGYPSMVYAHLTGAPTTRIDHNSVEKPNELWASVKLAHHKNYIVSACRYENDLDSNPSNSLSSYSYTIMSTLSLKVSGHKVKLFKLRNPWSVFEWTGDWSDKSDKWTEELRK